MTLHDFERLIQCITCANDINKCNCTEKDEDEYGFCKQYVPRQKGKKNDTTNR